MNMLHCDRIASPLGEVMLVVDNEHLCALGFDECAERMLGPLERRFGPIRLEQADDPGGVSSRIRAYFGGDLAALDGIPVCTGGTAFQQAVWAALRAIPPGTTLGYGQLAARLGRPAAARAVGAANGANPVALVVPCHRLVGANGALIHYGGGVKRKRWLLGHEGVFGR